MPASQDFAQSRTFGDSRRNHPSAGTCQFIATRPIRTFHAHGPMVPGYPQPWTVERIADAVQNVGAPGPEFNVNLPAPGDASRYRDDMESQANDLARGVMRLFAELGHVSVAELTLPSGRRADVTTLSRDGELSIIEIKCSVADFKADEKWPEYLEWCDRFFFAVPEEFPQELLPADRGLIVADGYGGDILRPAETRKLNANRRRSLTLRYARHAATRLRSLNDPDVG